MWGKTPLNLKQELSRVQNIVIVKRNSLMKPIDRCLRNNFPRVRSVMLELLVTMLEAGMPVAAVVVQLKMMLLRDRNASC